jgi:D-alanine-D-alanine ligase-like ATP-grasp enzyme
MTKQPSSPVESQDWYPYLTRRLIYLFDQGFLSNVLSIDVEPDFGYLARINFRNGSHRIISGNDLGLNTGTSADLANDKGYSKFVLRLMDIRVAPGAEFLLPNWADTILKRSRQQRNPNIRTTREADEFIRENFGYPAYLKPIRGSQGNLVNMVFETDELEQVLTSFDEASVRVPVIEAPVHMPDFRIVMLDGELISAYERVPLSVVGDGEKTITELLRELQQRYELEGRDTRINAEDTRIIRTLQRRGMTLTSVPAKNLKIVLLPISNLSAGGTAVDVSETIHPKWVELSAFIAMSFNLRLSGLDLACQDISAPDSPYYVLEINAAPGLDHYAATGENQRIIVDNFYAKIFNSPGIS